MSNPGFRMGEGDWICSDLQCANINFARRTQCNRCGAEKAEPVGKKKLGQEIGTAAAAKSHGLFSADDWQCVKCANVNWARRQQCNVCNSPRFGEIEERTGLGGGYNDRGVVEYKKREDSDDEFDEFGRRKKRQRINSDRSANGKESDTEAKEKVDDEEKKVKADDGEKEENEAGGEEEEQDEEEEEEDDDDDDGDLSKYDLSDWADAKK